MVSRCSVCGETFESKEEALTSFVDGEVFLFTPKEFIERMQNAWDVQYADEDFPMTFRYSVTSSGMITFDICNQNNVILGWGCFYDPDGSSLNISDEDQPIAMVLVFSGPIEGAEVETIHFFLKCLAGPAASAVDPSIDGIIYESPITNNLFSKTTDKTLNGLHYSCGYDKEDGYMYILIEIAENG